MARLKSVAVLTLAAAAYFAAVAYLLSRSTFQLYGFPVSPDLQSAMEIALQICPMLAALFMVLTSSYRERAIGRVALSFPSSGRWTYTAAMVAVNLFLAAITTALTAGAILTVCGLQPNILHPATFAWIAFELTIDLTLIGTFTLFLYTLTRRVWATLLLFFLYAALVIGFGTQWGVTSFIGFGSTVPVRLTSYSVWPLYDTAGWLFRWYWISVTGLLIAVLHHFSRPPETLAVALYKRWAQTTKQWKYGLGIGCMACIAIALCLSQIQQHALSRYRAPSPRRFDSMLSADPGDGRLRIANYDLELVYQPAQQTVRVLGGLTLENKDVPMRVAYLRVPSELALDRIDLQDAGSYRLTTVGKYIRVDLAAPLSPDRRIKLQYSGTIHPAGPFDLTLQAKLLKEAFFFTNSDLLLEPRRSSCLFSQPSLQQKGIVGCEAENYTMSDLATGTIRVDAPSGYVVIGPGDRLPGSVGQSLLQVATPQATTFMVACAHFVESSTPATDAFPAVRVYRATLDGSAQAEVARSVVGFYQASWPRYRLDELRIVETPTPLGEAVAFDGVIAVSDRIVRSRDPVSTRTSNLTQLVLAHEIAHQWWGYEVIPSRSPGRLFVLESFAQFAAYKYLESRSTLSEDAAIQSEKNSYQLVRAHAAEREVPLPLLEHDLGLAYHKGPFILLSLDKTLGNSLMNRFGVLIGLFALPNPSPVQPLKIVETLIDQLPGSNKAAARSLLFATTMQSQPAIRSEMLDSSQHPRQ